MFVKILLRLSSLSKVSHNQKVLCRYAGHSKWANIKFKKMHKDNARSKIFGKLSLEIIQAVKENGPDPSQNSKLDGIISKAKSNSMPKDKIETAIKNALRGTTEKLLNQVLQARGPGKCGFMIDLLTPNIVRSKNEIRNILKKNDCIYIEDGSVAFMFSQKGVLTTKCENMKTDQIEDEVEEVAIMIGAEDFILNDDDESTTEIKFLSSPMSLNNLQLELQTNYKSYATISAEVQYIANTLSKLSMENIEKADRIIEIISDHPDVINVYDNIAGYTSATIKAQDVT